MQIVENPTIDDLILACERHVLPSVYIEEIHQILYYVRQARWANEKGPKYIGKCDGCEKGRRL